MLKFGLAAWGGLFMGGTALASAFTIAGGELDPAFSDVDVYMTTPPPAPAPATRACEVAARYVELVNGGQFLEAARLFHDEATFLEPVRPSLKGRAQIDEFFTETIARIRPHVIPVAYTGDDRECMVVLANRFNHDGRPRYALASVDHFILRDDGKVDSMVAFVRPGPQAHTMPQRPPVKQP